MNTTPPKSSPLLLVGSLDLVGETLCLSLSGEKVPIASLMSAMATLRFVRDTLAKENGIGEERQFGTPAFTAEMMASEIFEDDSSPDDA